MSTTYTADPDAAPLAPDAGQKPEATPAITLPADGDLANAASIAQAFKVLANHLARAMKPKGSTSAAVRHLYRGRTSLGHTRWALDRNGLPAGTYLQMQERWPFVTGLSGDPSGRVLPNYPGVNWVNICSAVASGIVFVHPPAATYAGVPNDRMGMVRICAGDVLNQFYGLQAAPMCAFHADADIAWETILNVGDDAGATRPDVMAGITDVFVGDPRTIPGCYFLRDITKANWQAVTRDATSETMTDTGVAVSAGANMRMRIEYRGANVNDGGTKAVYFYIGQALVATNTTTVPITGSAAPLMAAKNTAGATILRSNPGDLYHGPLNMACNLMPSVTT
jgi:hypothetical protein